MNIYEYIKEFKDLQVSVVYMNEANGLDIFKRWLKKVRKNIILNNYFIMNEFIAYAQHILGAYGIIYEKIVT